jgi:lipopolysaccharide export system permease protein
MNLLKKYLFTIFSNSFFPIFLTLYLVTSIIFLVKIATLTSVIQINFVELMRLYSYSIPHILFYTLPISYFITISLTLSKLSQDYELIILTSFGMNPFRIIKFLLPITIIVTILLLVISLGLIPKAKYLKEVFLNIKKQEAQFNIKASKYGQQIGKWLIYVDKEKKQHFKDIVLLKIEDGKDTFISSNTANIQILPGSLNINLKNGKSFTISDTITQIDFKKMILNQPTISAKNITSLKDFIKYWQDRDVNRGKSEEFTFKILISLLPLSSLFFTLAIGYFNPRYNTNKATILPSILIIIFVLTSDKLSKIYPNTGLLVFPFMWFSLGYIYYWFTTKKSY